MKLCVCLMVKNYLTLNDLNDTIASFPSQFSYKSNRPQTLKTTSDARLMVKPSVMEVGLLVGLGCRSTYLLDVREELVNKEEEEIRDVPTGFAMLLGTISCLNLEYPQNMRYNLHLSSFNR